MKYSDKQLHTVATDILTVKDVAKSMGVLRSIINDNALTEFDARIENIENDYRLMSNYLRQGLRDPKLEDVYNGLICTLYRLYSDILLALSIRDNASYHMASVQHVQADMQQDAIREQLERFVQDLAMLSLEAEDTRRDKQRSIYELHQKYMDALFDALLVSPQWSDGTARFFGEILLSPTIDAIDASIMLGAIMLSAIQIFDVNKFLTLAKVAIEATDEHIRQRALVGTVLVLPQNDMSIFPEVRNTVDRICKDESLYRQLLELQMQIFYCMNADADNDKIQRDIMPELLKNNHLRFSSNGIIEKEDDQLEEILNPGASDKAMEDLEKSFSRMMSMQRAGSDIYFGGFSQMKRFSFFYQISNWFSPFYTDHPGLRHVNDKLGESKFMKVLLDNGPFCDSDKYSFALAMSTVIDRIPENMREMLNTTEIMGPMMTVEEKEAPAYIRRMYLQDLYRFFRLYQNKADFINPFAETDRRYFFFINKLVATPAMNGLVIELGNFLLKNHYYAQLIKLLRHYELSGNIDYYRLSAAAYMKTGDAYQAYNEYEKLLSLNGEDLQALKGKARTLYLMGEYADAEECYRMILEREPDNVRASLHFAISQIYINKVGEGMNILFKLYYDYPDDLNIERALAWGHLHQSKPDLAETIYERILKSGKTVKEDYLNAGYAKWFQSKNEEALSLFAQYAGDDKSAEVGHSLQEMFANDRTLLDKYNISVSEAKIIADLSMNYIHK
ncbi:tetratricopeptide repeat protein [Hoylesella oralis ATCC 33269]|uniref:Tetratricopeptide repeat protein n=2 Tax=Hoylesella oralis TaxID=28134 RepID=E7RTB4_9BACT|nr:tetratricopeptide repeat protein [Hoylesella oralis]EFZ35920.1 tetratricopeptide repeat protein [Hoylesella oralis ATCC 33269]